MIYVDPLFDTTPWTRAGTPRCFRNALSCHMVSDAGTAELVTFARRLGLKPQWIQKPGTRFEHFDLVPSKRALAVKLGAVEVEKHRFRLRT